MLYCGDCGGTLRCKKNGALIFSGTLDKVRRTDAYLCEKCDQMVLIGHGDNWRDSHIEQINLAPRYNISLDYDHYSAVEQRPICADCRKIMDFMGDGILLLEDEHSYQEGKMWSCPHCDYIFIDRNHTGWSAPLTIDEKRELEEKYAPNIVRIGTGVIPWFDSIKKYEEEEGSGNPHLDYLLKQGEEHLKEYLKESVK